MPIELQTALQVNNKSTVKQPRHINRNSKIYKFWFNALIERIQSQIHIENFPDIWKGFRIKQFFYDLLLRENQIGFYDEEELGKMFGRCTTSGINAFYQPTKAIFANPALPNSIERVIDEDCVVINLSPCGMDVASIADYYAMKLALLDSDIDVNLWVAKTPYILGASEKSLLSALKATVEKTLEGDTVTIIDTETSKGIIGKDGKNEIFTHVKLFENSDFIADKLIMAHADILSQFDNEIGINTLPYQKKGNMVAFEAESREQDSQARILLWIDTLNDGLNNVNKMFGFNMKASVRVEKDLTGEVAEERGNDGKDNDMGN